MEKAAIICESNKLKNRDDLLILLNHIKEDRMAQMGYSRTYHPFSKKHMNYYCNPNNTFHRYTTFEIKKKTGGLRQISAPRNPSFKFLLRCLNELLKAVYTPSQYAMGFAEGCSVVNNADKHKHMNYVLNLDLKDFFPSIHQARLWKRLQIKPFNYPEKVASAIAGLCCMKVDCQDEDNVKKICYVLPQGAPTSPIVTNMICDKLDHRLSGVAKRFGVNYSRYADDITFSSMHNVYRKDGDFVKEVYRIITEQGFTINEKKVRLQKRGGRQEVTGLVVNDKINVTQNYVRNIRNILFIWQKYGYNVAFHKFLSKYNEEKGHIKKGTPDLINVLNGKLLYLKMVKGEEDSVYVRLHNKFKDLVEKLSTPNNTTMGGVTYIETVPVIEFENENSTEIVITSTNNGNNENHIGENAQKTSHRYAYFVIEGRKVFATINKSLSAEEANQKDRLAISSCLGKNGSLFWLIHKIDKVTVPPLTKVDIDKLLNDLDTLLQ